MKLYDPRLKVLPDARVLPRKLSWWNRCQLGLKNLAPNRNRKDSFTAGKAGAQKQQQIVQSNVSLPQATSHQVWPSYYSPYSWEDKQCPLRREEAYFEPRFHRNSCWWGSINYQNSLKKPVTKKIAESQFITTTFPLLCYYLVLISRKTTHSKSMLIF